jgi:23S rRNA (guanosine2251-2'-O)-methyltransferase
MGNRPRSQSDRRHKHADLGAATQTKSEDDLFQILNGLEEDPFLLIIDGVQDPHNLGACLRSAEAAGVHAVIVPRDRAVGLTDVVRLAAAGAAELIPLVQVTNLARTMKALKDAGLWLVGTADKADSYIYDVDMAGPLAIVMGAEGKGLRHLTEEYCDFLVRIPMHGKVGCLNVSVATGVCLFEAVRQRAARKSNRK